ncbi:MAG: hypothetical protein U0869_03370 [Chloroflexota bacterium]
MGGGGGRRGGGGGVRDAPRGGLPRCPEKLRDVTLTLNRIEVPAPTSWMPRFGLAAHVRALGGTQPTVRVNVPTLSAPSTRSSRRRTSATLRAYLRWHVVRQWASALPAAFADEAFAFYGRTLGGQQEQQARLKRALAGATADIGDSKA